MKRISKKVSLFILVVSLISIILASCGGKGGQSSSGKKEEVMIYTSIYPNIVDLVTPELEKEFLDLDIKWFQGGTEKVVTKLTGEVESGKINGDLIMVADPAYYLQLKNEDLLMEYESPNLKHVTSAKDPDNFWSAVRINLMVIAYNTDKVSEDEAPKSWADLLDPRWEGLFAMPNPLLSGTAFTAVGALANNPEHGWEYFEKLKDNGAFVEEGNAAVENKLLTGEYEVCMILEENILKLMEQGEPVKVVYPEDGIIINPSAIGILKDGPNPEAVKPIYDWWLSEEGQEAVVSGWMHPVRDDVDPPEGAPHLSTLRDKAIDIDWEKLSNENEQIKEKFRSILLE